MSCKRKIQLAHDHTADFAGSGVYPRTFIHSSADCGERPVRNGECAVFSEKTPPAELRRRLGDDGLSEKVYEHSVYHGYQSGIYYSHKLYGSLCHYKE